MGALGYKYGIFILYNNQKSYLYNVYNIQALESKSLITKANNGILDNSTKEEVSTYPCSNNHAFKSIMKECAIMNSKL